MITPLRSIAALLLLALLLAGCAGLPAGGQAQTPLPAQDEGSLGPAAVVDSFFDDLQSAVQDEALAEPDVRARWVDKLASYFAPSERDDQRAALQASLGGLVRAMAQRTSTRKLKLDLRLDRSLKISQTDDRALVRLVNARMVLVFTNDRGVQEDGESFGIDQLIGRSDIPVVRIGDRWFLTEDDA